MAQSKKTKPAAIKIKNSAAAAKQSLKKKKLQSNKSRNDAIREQLDRDASSILNIHGLPEPNLKPIINTNRPTDMSDSLTDVTTILQGL
ncbi:hypothetical protein D9619_011730 [Psilocybe cf. subviscida]|uniref:Uncharacterized protein n=1 Tax=Psilocybe cf. subviscida TaxID=2480587 RepID=A0A8H5BUQ6_9AGAR|nr:hypothetical protein D9619_011730 [Psilocybe cf. subviscida]